VPIAPTGDGGTAPPPEVHARVEPPASGRRYVYVAVPAEGSVVRIDSVDLQVESIPVGEDPTALRTVPGQAVAVVLGRASSRATILRARDDGGDDLVTLPTAPGVNSLQVSPDGRFALAWFDLAASGGALAPDQTLQEVTLLALGAGAERATDYSVGFR